MNAMINSNTESNERGLLHHPIILAANTGDAEAMNMVVLHYGNYMTYLSMRKLHDEQGNIYWGICVDTHNRLQSKFMQAVLAFKI